MEARKVSVIPQNLEKGRERTSRTENAEIIRAYMDGEAAAGLAFGRFGELLRKQRKKHKE